MATNQSNALWMKSPVRWLLLATAGAAACAGVYLVWPNVLLQAHLIAVVLWTGVSIGALMLLMLHRMVGGKWGLLLRPSLVAAVQPFWLLALAFIPVMLQLKMLYPWASWNRSTTAAHLLAKAQYLDPSMFMVRAAIYWAFWIIGAWIASRTVHMKGASLAWANRIHAVGLPLLVVTVTYAAVDWWMSLEPEWYASSYGILILAGQGAAALALTIAVAAVGPRFEPDAAEHAAEHSTHAPISPWRDVGNLLLAALCLWMYVSFSQFLIIWSGNLPEEATWYLARSRGIWKPIVVILVLFHFTVPFMFLLSKNVKENPRWLAAVAALVLVMHALEAVWLVAPAFGADWRLIMTSVLAMATVGAAWFFVFVLRWRKELEFAGSEVV